MAGHRQSDMHSPAEEHNMSHRGSTNLTRPQSSAYNVSLLTPTVSVSTIQASCTADARPAVMSRWPRSLQLRENNPQDCNALIRASVDRATVELSRTIIRLNATFSQQLSEASALATEGIKSANVSASSSIDFVIRSANIVTSSALSNMNIAQLSLTAATNALLSAQSSGLAANLALATATVSLTSISIASSTAVSGLSAISSVLSSSNIELSSALVSVSLASLSEVSSLLSASMRISSALVDISGTSSSEVLRLSSRLTVLQADLDSARGLASIQQASAISLISSQAQQLGQPVPTCQPIASSDLTTNGSLTTFGKANPLFHQATLIQVAIVTVVAVLLSVLLNGSICWWVLRMRYPREQVSYLDEKKIPPTTNSLVPKTSRTGYQVRTINEADTKLKPLMTNTIGITNTGLPDRVSAQYLLSQRRSVSDSPLAQIDRVQLNEFRFECAPIVRSSSMIGDEAEIIFKLSPECLEDKLYSAKATLDVKLMEHIEEKQFVIGKLNMNEHGEYRLATDRRELKQQTRNPDRALQIEGGEEKPPSGSTPSLSTREDDELGVLKAEVIKRTISHENEAEYKLRYATEEKQAGKNGEVAYSQSDPRAVDTDVEALGVDVGKMSEANEKGSAAKATNGAESEVEREARGATISEMLSAETGVRRLSIYEEHRTKLEVEDVLELESDTQAWSRRQAGFQRLQTTEQQALQSSEEVFRIKADEKNARTVVEAEIGSLSNTATPTDFGLEAEKDIGTAEQTANDLQAGEYANHKAEDEPRIVAQGPGKMQMYGLSVKEARRSLDVGNILEKGCDSDTQHTHIWVSTGERTAMMSDTRVVIGRGRLMTRTSDRIDPKASRLSQYDMTRFSPLIPVHGCTIPDILDRVVSTCRSDYISVSKPRRSKTLQPPWRKLSHESIVSRSQTVSPLRRNPYMPPISEPASSGDRTFSQTSLVPSHIPLEPDTLPTRTEPMRRKKQKNTQFSVALSKYQALAAQHTEVLKAKTEVTQRAMAGIFIPGSLREKAVSNAREEL